MCIDGRGVTMASLFLKRCSTKSINTFRYIGVQQRSITRTAFLKEKVPEVPRKKGTDYGSSERESNLYDKVVLVWAGKYKSFADVPTYIPRKAVDAAANKVRVKLAVVLCIVTAIGVVISAISGKRAAQRGESLGLAGEKYVQELRSQAAKEKAAAEGK